MLLALNLALQWAPIPSSGNNAVGLPGIKSKPLPCNESKSVSTSVRVIFAVSRRQRRHRVTKSVHLLIKNSSLSAFTSIC